MSKKKPDQVADNPNILPYASNVGAPVIKPNDLTSFKQEKLLKTNTYFKSKYEEIKKEYQDLIDSYEWNQLIYNSSLALNLKKVRFTIYIKGLMKNFFYQSLDQMNGIWYILVLLG